MAKEPLCKKCHLFQKLCLCGTIEQYTTQTRISLVIHKSEVSKMTNTGKLAHQILQNSQLYIYGREGHPISASDFYADEHNNVILYPNSDAKPLSEVLQDPRPLNLVVPDGHWGQARRMAKRINGHTNLQAISLPLTEPSHYRLRTHPDAAKICTIEAIHRALSICEPHAPNHRLMTVFQLMRDRLLKNRGMS